MAYFDKFPYVNYQFPDNIRRFYKNISIRPAILEKVLEQQSNFEELTVADGDTPETIAFDYYGNVNYHWIIMLSNNILNFYTDWPKPSAQFDEYLYQKYKDSDGESRLVVTEKVEFKGTPGTQYTNAAGWKPHHFEDTNKIQYDYDTVIAGTVTDAFGNTLDIPEVTPVSIYEYEEELNEAKREIIILKQNIVERLEEELRDLTDG